MAKGDPPTSPWHWEDGDYLGRKVACDVFFDDGVPAPHPIVAPGLTGTRDAGCLYAVIVVGVPGSGTEKTFAIPEGPFSVTVQQLHQRGLDTVEDVFGGNFTLGFA